MKKKSTLAKLRAANKEIKLLTMRLKEVKEDYEFLWKMRIEDERERFRK